MDPRHASASLSKWGLIQGWLAADPSRRVELRAGSNGLVVRVVDARMGEFTVDIGQNEETSTAVWRTIVILDRAR